MNVAAEVNRIVAEMLTEMSEKMHDPRDAAYLCGAASELFRAAT